MIRAVLFDFDGLILDTESPEFQSWSEIYQDHGCCLPRDLWIQSIGTAPGFFDPYGELERQMGRCVIREDLRQRHRTRHQELVASARTLAGVADYLEEARTLGLLIGLASSSPHSWVDTHLQRLGIHPYFNAIRCSDDVKAVKPDPELYVSLLDTLGVAAAEAIAFEDSSHGVHAARSAGIFCVAVPNPLTCELPLDHASLRIASMADVPLQHLIHQAELRQKSDSAYWI